MLASWVSAEGSAIKIENFLEVSLNFELEPTEALKTAQAQGVAFAFDWSELMAEEHAAAFTVAKMMDADLLTTVKTKLDRALAEGLTFAEFRKELIPELQKAGWWGKKDVVDPVTGEIVEARLGSASRLETIFRTNMQSAYSAGQWQAIREQAGTAPYLMYDAVDDHRTRPEHAANDGKVYPVSSNFWASHFPPNGYNCRCGVIQMDIDEVHEFGLNVERSVPSKSREWKNPRTGVTHILPDGVDPGFDYNPGKARIDNLNKVAKEKAAGIPAPGGPLVEKALKGADDAKQKYRQENPPAKIPGQTDPVFKPAETVAEAREWALDNGLARIVDYGKMNIEIVNEINESVHQHVLEFPELKSGLGFLGSMQARNRHAYDRELEHWKARAMSIYPELSEDEAREVAKKWAKKKKAPGRALAVAYRKHSNEIYKDLEGIMVNEKYAQGQGLADLDRLLERDVYSMFHPEGTATRRSVMDHEMGHQLDYLLDLRSDPEIRQMFVAWGGDRLTLSHYAAKNVAEFIAEAWAEYRNNPKPREIAQRVGEIIIERYKAKNP